MRTLYPFRQEGKLLPLIIERADQRKIVEIIGLIFREHGRGE
jgi:hypothetical protein